MNDAEAGRIDRSPFDETHPHLKEFSNFLPEFNKESDRGMVLIATSFLDELMRRILLAYFVKADGITPLVEGFNAPLGGLAARTVAAFALGLISVNEKQEADILRKIRNRFAHHFHISFEDHDVTDLCKNLSMSAPDYGAVIVDIRGKFCSSAVALILNLNNRPHYVAQHRCGFQEWPY